ncbi:MAG: hypothetical protein JRI58_13190 [Deltaproteobacteria bacterium]|nr:hypothetical protein [Deltaproteobacteria bacterium]
MDKNRIAGAYLQGEEFEKAANAAEDFQREHPNHPLRFRSILIQGKAIIKIGHTREGRKVLLNLSKETPDQGRFKEADEIFSRIDKESSLYKKAAKARRYLAGAEEIPLKSPELAGLLGAILPGAGHLYAERRGSAVFAFMFTGAFATATMEAFSNEHNELGCGLAAITGLIYAGNIFSAVNVAHNHNLKQTKAFKPQANQSVQGKDHGYNQSWNVGRRRRNFHAFPGMVLLT